MTERRAVLVTGAARGIGRAIAGRLERRLRSADGTAEVHVIRFETTDGLHAYRADPRRKQHAPDLEASGAEIELLEVEDVPTA